MAEGVEDSLVIRSTGVQAEVFGVFGLFGLDVCWQVLVSEGSVVTEFWLDQSSIGQVTGIDSNTRLERPSRRFNSLLLSFLRSKGHSRFV